MNSLTDFIHEQDIRVSLSLKYSEKTLLISES